MGVQAKVEKEREKGVNNEKERKKNLEICLENGVDDANEYLAAYFLLRQCTCIFSCLFLFFIKYFLFLFVCVSILFHCVYIK